MKARAEAFIHRHFESVYQSDEFLAMPFDQLLALLSSDSVSVASEETTFRGTCLPACMPACLPVAGWLCLHARSLACLCSPSSLLAPLVTTTAVARWVMHDVEARGQHILSLLCTVRLEVRKEGRTR